MTAISKTFQTIADAQIAPDSPIDTALMTSIRDALIYLREWTGAGYYAGAVQNHDHDGVNSALVPIGPNFLRNGSFEGNTAGWTLTQYTGGTVGSSATNLNGANSLAITSTVLANGGGDAVSNEYTPVSGGANYDLKGEVLASVANVSCKAEIIWYDSTKTQISITNAYSSSNTPTGLTRIGGNFAAPANARFMRQKITGGVPATGTAVGTIYFDGFISATGGGKLVKFTIITASNASWAKQVDTTTIVCACQGADGGGGGGGGAETTTSPYYPGGVGGLGAGARQFIFAQINSPAATLNAVVGAGGTGGNGGANNTVGSTGGTGGTSSFDGLASAPGASGGLGGQPGTIGLGVGANGASPSNVNSVAGLGGVGGVGGNLYGPNSGSSPTNGTAGVAGKILVWEYA